MACDLHRDSVSCSAVLRVPPPRITVPHHFFVTGGTGLVGLNLLPRLLRTSPDSTITLLLRTGDERSTEQRVHAIATRLSSDFGIPEAPLRLTGVAGDVTRDGCGISEGHLSSLLRDTTHIIHGAATIRFDHPLEEARKINLEGTRRMLELARRCTDQGSLQRFLYIGTSSVSGQREGPIFEHELEMGQTFFNTYEQSKQESERLVRDHFATVPTTIVRPSIIIGDSTTGRTTSFNVIYIPLRLFQRGLLTFIPGAPETLLDLVPVDWIDDVITYLAGLKEAEGKVCHLTAGPKRAVSLAELLKLAAEFFEVRSPLDHRRTMEYITREEFQRRRTMMAGKLESLMAQLDTLLPYVSVNRLFDSATTDALLRGSGIAFPEFRDYAERIFNYCVKTQWGKKAE
jgi:nucleoside-diphosphate-sugar epimerase